MKPNTFNTMPFPTQLQTSANKTISDAKFLVDNHIAKWQLLLLPDGTEVVALCFPTRLWELGEGGSLRLIAGGTNESDNKNPV